MWWRGSAGELGSIGSTFLSILWLLIPAARSLVGAGGVRMEDTTNFSALQPSECESFLSWNNFNRKPGSNLVRKTCKNPFSSFFFCLVEIVFFFFPQTIFMHEHFEKALKLQSCNTCGIRALGGGFFKEQLSSSQLEKKIIYVWDSLLKILNNFCSLWRVRKWLDFLLKR